MAIDRSFMSTWVDDSGGTVPDGTIFSVASITAILNAVDNALGFGVTQSTILTGTQNDFPLTPGCGLLRCVNPSLLTLTGLSAGVDGQLLLILASGAGQIDLTNQGAGSTAANRMSQGVTGSRSLAPSLGCALYVYEAGTLRWRLVLHEQGAWITQGFSAGDYSAAAAMTWTVAAGDVEVSRYLLRGSTLFLEKALVTTTVGGTLTNALQFTLPVNLQAAGSYYGHGYLLDNLARTSALIQSTAASGIMKVTRYDDANFTASTNLTYLYATVQTEVQ